MEFLNRINWASDDGVFFPMLVDFRRNQYYDNIIEHEVRGKSCVDVGFGTGLLSMMALKHGAQKITAYEKDPNRFELGQYIIDQLDLGHCIQLLNDEFTWRTPVDPDAIIISETVGTQIWSENLWQSIPRQGQQTWLPGSVFIDIIAEPIPHAFATDLFRDVEHFSCFNPAVDLDNRFVELINKLSGKKEPDRTDFYTTDQSRSNLWGGWPFLRFAQHGKTPRAGYQVNIGKQTIAMSDSRGQTSKPIDFDIDCIELVLDLPQVKDLPVLIQPRAGFRHTGPTGTHTLYLDTAEGWACGCRGLIVTDATKTVTIKHNIKSGIFDFYQE